jgi:O-antigen/teichoic acid export membrane protein
MTQASTRTPTAAPHTHPDASGRGRMAWNVLASWAGHLVFIAAGFIMPRLIDRHLGQTLLGVWDFGWSIVSYFGLAQVGVGSSVNRYVAQYRSHGDVAGLRRTVSSVSAIQLAATIFALGLTAALTWWLPWLFGARLGLTVDTARWVIALLGASVAVQVAFNAYGGVLTGCHRWDIHNAINAGGYAVIVAGMAIALSLGGGLRALSAVYLVGTIASELTRAVMAHRICRELQVSLRLATWRDTREMLAFGGKTVVDNLSRLLLGQANSILVAVHLGPAALALYARPWALARHADTLTNKFAVTLTPTASSLKSTRQDAELRELFIGAMRFAAFLAMPITVFLSVMADPILDVWMGPQYRHGLLMTVLAVGNFLPLTQRPAGHMMIGLNAHGRVGWASFAVACIGVAAAAIALGPLDMGLVGAALALVVPYSLGNGLFVMVYACRRVGVPLVQFCRRVFLAPLLCSVPLFVVLAACRVGFRGAPALSLMVASATSAALLIPLYWRYALPADVREKLRRQLRRRREGPGKTVLASTPAPAVADVAGVEGRG